MFRSADKAIDDFFASVMKDSLTDSCCFKFFAGFQVFAGDLD
jgi:hypothetical protein